MALHIALVCLSRFPCGHYGGTERVVYWLADALVTLGHRVSLVCYAGSHHINADITCIPCEDAADIDRLLPDDIDIVHFHDPALHSTRFPFLITLHGNAKEPLPYLRQTVGVSRDHAKRHGLAHYVYNGVALNNEIQFNATPADYLAFLSKVSRRCKGVHTALQIARDMQFPLKVGGGTRFDCRKRLSGLWASLFAEVSFLGELSGMDKATLLSNASALLFPIEWEEPFGLVMIEALLCGTPVIAYRRGSVPELVPRDVGFVVDTLDEMKDAIRSIERIDRKRCHVWAKEHFSMSVCASHYVSVYQRRLEE